MSIKEGARPLATTEFGGPEIPSNIDAEIATPALEVTTLPTLTDLTEFNSKLIEKVEHGLQAKRAIVLYGSPGTGKTYLARQVAKKWTGDDLARFKMVQFHPGYTYEDFITGIKTDVQDKQIVYKWQPGVFTEFALNASEGDGFFVIVIDEVNRSEPARVLGELMFLLEYRGSSVTLPSGEELTLPDNLFVICTMNSADKSITPMDHAMRRRFAWIRIKTDYDLIKKWWDQFGLGEEISNAVKTVNEKIADDDLEIGHSYFRPPPKLDDVETHLRMVWQTEIEPYIADILRTRPEENRSSQWAKIRTLIFNKKDRS